MSGGSGGRSAEAAAERRAAAGPAAACAWSAVDSSARHIRDAVYSLYSIVISRHSLKARDPDSARALTSLYGFNLSRWLLYRCRLGAYHPLTRIPNRDDSD